MTITDITQLTDAQIKIAFETGYFRCLMRHADHLLHDAMVMEADRAAERYMFSITQLRDAKVAAEEETRP